MAVVIAINDTVIIGFPFSFSFFHNYAFFIKSPLEYSKVFVIILKAISTHEKKKKIIGVKDKIREKIFFEIVAIMKEGKKIISILSLWFNLYTILKALNVFHELPFF